MRSRTNNTQPGSFMNKGKIGNWKEHFNDEMLQKFKEWEQKWLKNSDLKFIYEI